jgi:hypothetical protein
MTIGANKGVSRMKEFRFGISHTNEGILEGVIMGSPRKAISGNGEEAINFTMNLHRYTSSGEKYFQYEVVMFKASPEIVAAIQDGYFVKINYHLMSVPVTNELGVTQMLCKPVVDYIQIDD